MKVLIIERFSYELSSTSLPSERSAQEAHNKLPLSLSLSLSLSFSQQTHLEPLLGSINASTKDQKLIHTQFNTQKYYTGHKSSQMLHWYTRCNNEQWQCVGQGGKVTRERERERERERWELQLVGWQVSHFCKLNVLRGMKNWHKR